MLYKLHLSSHFLSSESFARIAHTAIMQSDHQAVNRRIITEAVQIRAAQTQKSKTTVPLPASFALLSACILPGSR